MKMWIHFKEKEKQLNQKNKQKKTQQKLLSVQSEYKPATWRRDCILSGSKCWLTMKPINQSQKHGIANAIVSLLFSACKVMLRIFTFVLNGKLESPISPMFPIYCRHLWGGRHCWSHCVRLTVDFYFGWMGFLFFQFFGGFFWKGVGRASSIVCQSIHCFHLTMTCGFEKRK